MSRSMPQPRYNQAQVQPPNPSIHSLLSSQPGVSFNPNKPAFIPSPSGPHGNIAAAHLQSLAASQAQAQAHAQAQAAQAAQLQAQAQAALHLNLQSLNAKIVQAQQLALINGISVDEVLRRMGGLSEAEVGLLKLCVVREQEERLKVQAVGLMSQQQQAPFQPQTQTRAPLRTTSPPNITLNSPPPSSTTATSAQEQRAAARLKVEQNLRARCGKEQPQVHAQVQSSGGWEEAFAKMNIGLSAGQRFTQGQGMVMTPPQGRVDLPPVTSSRTTQPPQVSSPIVRSFSPANLAHSASSDSVNVKKDVTPTPAQNKHVQAVSWRAVGNLQQAPVSPAASPLSVKLTAQNAENAVKSFNGVFGNKVVTPSQATFGGNIHASSSPTRLTRSGSGSSGSGQSSVGDEASVASSSPSLSGGRRRRSSGSCDTGMTTPVSEGESGDKANYFGSKNLQVHGRDESYPLSKVSSKGSNASVANSNASFGIGAGVIGQGYPGEQKTAVVQFSTVIRQPHGPPGGADELGNKNFASRIRQKAVSDLSVLGRRVAQRSPTVPSY